MKKLKLSGKDIRRLGIHDAGVISIVKNEMQKHYRHASKKQVQALLEEVLNAPENFLKHETLSKIAQELYQGTGQEKTGGSPQSVDFQKDNPFEIFGEQFIDPGALEQMQTAMQLPVSVKGAIMPDAHHGYGLPIGGVLATRNAVIPFGVGMDIGCRMALSIYPVESGIIDRDGKKLKNILVENTRFGKAEFAESKEHSLFERSEFKEISFLKGLRKKAIEQLGSSGSGNHFVDIGVLEISEEGVLSGIDPGEYLAILSHSGSRGMGADIARHYTAIARKNLDLPKGAKKLAWLDLDSAEGQEYWKAMNLAGDYSAANHEVIHEKLAKALGEQPLMRIENHHNFAWMERGEDGNPWVVHRKGATPAAKGDLGIIPGSMASPAFVVRGKGFGPSVNSAAHGAGRVMSRAKAKKTFTETQIKTVLQENGITLIGGGPDEAPMVYKDIRKVMDLQQEMVETIATFHPKIVRMG